MEQLGFNVRTVCDLNCDTIDQVQPLFDLFNQEELKGSSMHMIDIIKE